MATTLAFEILPETQYTAYQWELLDASGKVIKAHDVSVEEANNPILFSLSGPLPAGRYVLVVRGVREGGNRPEVARFPFNAKPVE
ncbi:MAG TPA: hypothetical protein VN181_03970 [Thermoanaerobaculia bacterium]|nr:hypothetical protein [Thermoanaerobaculia bacterium]